MIGLTHCRLRWSMFLVSVCLAAMAGIADGESGSLRAISTSDLAIEGHFAVPDNWPMTLHLPVAAGLPRVSVSDSAATIDFPPGVLTILDEATLAELFHEFSNVFSFDAQVRDLRLTCEGQLLADFLTPVKVDFDVEPAPLDTWAIEGGIGPEQTGLGGLNITIGPSHGRFWNGSGWYWQRSDPCGLGEAVLEDTNSIRLMQYLYQYLVQDGATVHVCRTLDESTCCHSTGYAWWKMAAYIWLRNAGLPCSVYANSSGICSSDTGSVSRSGDDIRSRPLFADYRGSHIYLSHHTNGAAGTGTITYRDSAMTYQTHVANSLTLATKVQAGIVNTVREMYDSGWRDRGIGNSNGGFGEIRIPNRPACLVELAFHDRCDKDALYLIDDWFRSLATWGEYKGLCDYFGRTPTWDKYSCELVSNTIPATMNAGQSYSIGITYRNRGVLWTNARNYKLGAVGDSDPFAATRHTINGPTVRPGATHTFTFTMTAPSTPGTYTTDWRMIREGVTWFGPTLTKQVEVQTAGPQPPTITQQPAARTVSEGTNATFTVQAIGDAPLAYRWQKNNTNLSNGGSISGATAATLTIAAATVADEANYRCVVTNPYGSQTSSNAALTVRGALITDFEGFSDGVQVMFRQPSFSGSTSPHLETTPNTSRVVAGSAFGGSKVYQVDWAFIDTDPRRWLRLTTSGTGNVPNPAVDLTRPIRFRIRLNNTGSLRVCLGIRETGTNVAIGADGGTTGTIEWLGATTVTSGAPQGTLISDQGGAWQTLSFDPVVDPVAGFTGDGVLGAANNKGVLEHVGFAVVSSVGPFSVDLDVFEQMTPPPRTPPQITAQPTPQALCPGAQASFSVTATGDGVLSYRWQKNGSNLSDGGRIFGSDNHTLQIADVVSGDVGNYRCVVSNLGGEATSNTAALSVKVVTAITVHPQSQTIDLGATATLTVAGSGAGTVSYRWQKNGVDLNNGGTMSGVTTPTLQITDFAPLDEGSYRCMVSADCGSLPSDVALLDVYTPPPIPGDFDGDGDVDLDDFAFLQACFTGSGVAPTQPQCNDADFDVDEDVDAVDLNRFLNCFSGADLPGDPGCAG